jgi:hypothetical protein
MKYMLLLRFEPGAGPEEGTPEFAEEMATWGRLNQEMENAGVLISAAGLEPDEAATTVRTREGGRVVTDGPFAEAKEILFSYYVINVADLDAAIEWAEKMPATGYGSVEVRPLSAIEQAAT